MLSNFRQFVYRQKILSTILHLLMIIIMFSSVPEESGKTYAQQDKRPNILVIVADDMGYSDIGCYGGEIQTPNLDTLAHNGIRFTSFCNTARCWPSRSALMSGYYPQQFNMDPIRPNHPDWVTYIPQHLQKSGYRCYQSGKWHVMSAPKLIANAGFHHSYEILDHDRHFNPQKRRRDDLPVPPVKKGTDYYSTIDITNELIDQLQDHATTMPGKPFFAYVAFIAPHFPLMAPSQDIDRYKDTYHCGWDIIRQNRYQKMKESGIYRGNLSKRESTLGPPYRFPDVPKELGSGEVMYPVDWKSLTEEQKNFQATKMSIHAAMIDRMDQEIGRIVEQLKKMNVLDNTVIFFLSDNGASAEIMIRGDRNNPNAVPGSDESFLCLGPGFSTAANTPFRRHKTWVHEGGISTPLIVYAPSLIPKGNVITEQQGHLIDLAPTILELAQTPCPVEKPYPGISLVPVLKEGLILPHPPIYFCHEGNKALKMDHWKIVLAKGDQKKGEPELWELYNLDNDRAEQNNLAKQYPKKVQEMAAIWKKMDLQFQQDSQSKNTATNQNRELKKNRNKKKESKQ